jgi:asparagine synthase (glutamine-hydrolysing)
MCGIAGMFQPGGLGEEGAASTLEAMIGRISYRGPDDRGCWVDAEAGIALGHCRLSIVDLSSHGHQPMQSACGRYVVSYNGEVYNFQELRAELTHRGHVFRGRSDTEVLVAAVAEWGLRQALDRFNGMFALALWDRRDRVLHLVRDRIGEKPLYYGWVGRTLVFASELKAVAAFPGFTGDIDRDSVALFLRHRSVPAPYSIYQGIRKLPPGMVLTVGAHDPRAPEPTAYWCSRQVAEQSAGDALGGTQEEILTTLHALLLEATKLRMEADVPLGAFLSGGIDSSLVVALMQLHTPLPIQTFTIGFQEGAYDEAQHARAIARHLGTAHTELYVTADHAMELVPRLASIYDEPLSDPSQIPTYFVSQLARGSVTVSLSGDGGDELFGGYRRYVWARNIWRAIGWAPFGLRRVLADAFAGVPSGRWDRLLGWAQPLLPRQIGKRSPGTRLHQFAEILAAESPEAVHSWLVSDWRQGSKTIVLGAPEVPSLLTDPRRLPNLIGFLERMMYLDATTFLPDDILVKVDRATMSVSLESRMPLLDPRVIEFAWRLPMSMKIRNGVGKWSLRQLLRRYIPDALLDRPKMGFCAPVDVWLRGRLRDWAESLLDERRLRQGGIFDPAPIRMRWGQHLRGERDWHRDLWDVLMFQAWFEAAGAWRAPGNTSHARHGLSFVPTATGEGGSVFERRASRPLLSQ